MDSYIHLSRSSKMSAAPSQVDFPAESKTNLKEDCRNTDVADPEATEAPSCPPASFPENALPTLVINNCNFFNDTQIRRLIHLGRPTF